MSRNINITRPIILILLLITAVLFLPTHPAWSATWYVDTASSEGGDGSQTSPFKTINSAEAAASNSDEIHVKQGTYNLYQSGTGPSTIILTSGVYLRGGYTNDWSSQEADPTKTIISGESTVRCMYGSELSTATTIENFTIEHGYRSTSPYYGGGLYITSSTPNIINCAFLYNDCADSGNGGGIYCNNSSPIITGCRFTGNHAPYYGGGIYNSGGSPNITSCIFTSNGVVCGGGIFNMGSSPTITNCTFINNNASYGAGVGNWGGSNPIIKNCTFTYNISYGRPAGGVFNYNSSGTIINSIIYNNNAGSIYVYAGSSPTVTYSCIEGGYTGTGNITAEPRFVSTSESDPGFLRLGAGSPCIDTASTEAPSTDLTGEARPRGLGNDMGAYEFQGPSISIEAPNGGEMITAETTYPVTFNISPDASEIYVRASSNEGNAWTEITYEAGAHTGVCTYEWLVPSSFISTECLISIEAFGNSIWNYNTSNATFEIVSAYAGPIWYVDAASPEGGDGSQTHPFRTINSSEATAIAGNEIHVKQGTYSLYPTPGTITLKSGVYLRGGYRTDDWSSQEADPSKTVISGEGSVQCMYGNGLSAATTIENFTIRNGNCGNGDGGGIYLSSSSPTISKCNFIGNQTSNPSNGGGGIFNWSSSPTITNCTFTGNSATNGGGISNWWPASTPIINNCTFTNNSAVNGGGVSNLSSSPVIKNSIIYNNTGGDIYNQQISSLPHPSISYSCVPGYEGTNGNINSDPLFVSTDPANSNFLRLGAGSPCIDTASTEAPTLDLDNKARPRGFGNDMGAYEFQGPSISIEAPNGGEPLTAGVSYEIQWETSPESVTDVQIRLSTDEGTTWWDTPITDESWSHSPGISTYEWTPSQSMVSANCLISVEVSGEVSGIHNCDTSDATFEINARAQNIWYVDAASPEGGSGSQTFPFKTINSAEAAAISGDEIRVKQGTYDLYQIGAGPGTITLKDGVYLRGGYNDSWDQTGGSSTTIISGEDSVKCMYGNGLVATTTIENFTIRNGVDNSGGGSSLGILSSFLTISKCIFAFNSGYHNIYNNGGAPVISNCIFINNNAINSSGLSSNGSSSSPVISNCTFTNNSSTHGSVLWNWNSPYPIITNSIIYGNTFPIFDNSYPTATYSCIQGSYTGNLDADPLFYNAAAGDVRLYNNSLCVNSGSASAASLGLGYAQGYGTNPNGTNGDSGTVDMGYHYSGYTLEAVTDFTLPTVEVGSPASGNTWLEGTTHDITWEATDNDGFIANPISIYYSTDGGATYPYTIATNEANDGSYSWTVPNTPTSGAKVKITAVDISYNLGSGESDATFEITQMPAVVYISPSGDDIGGNGTINHPYATVQKGLDEVPASGEVRMMSGTYNEHDIIWPDKPDITLKLSPEATEPATIDALSLGRCISVESAVNLTIEGITISNGKVIYDGGGLATYGGGIYLRSGSKLWLDRVIIRNCTSEGFSGYGGAIGGYDMTVNVKDSAFSGNSAGCGGGVAYKGTWTVTNSIFSGNNIVPIGGYGGGGVAFDSAWTVTNSTFSRNSSSYGGVARGGAWTATNSIFAGGSDDKFNSVSGNINYSDIYPADPDAPTTEGCISKDPLFVSTLESDSGFLRLSAGSPCIDTASTEAPSPDLANNPRPRGLGNDMGAYEFQGPSISVEAPNGGESLTVGVTYEIQWETSPESVTDVKIRLSTDEGTTWLDTPITDESGTHSPGINTYDWTPLLSMISTECLISVEAIGASSLIWTHDTSDATFEIAAGGPPPSGNVPTIEAIWINGMRFRSRDVISSTVSIDALISSESGLSSPAILYVDGVPFTLDLASAPGPHETWHDDFSMPQSSQRRRVLTFLMTDPNGVGINTVEAGVYGGRVQLIGNPYNYPNPFQPMSGGTTSIQYTLSTDSAITILIYDITGHEVKRIKYGAGTAGGRGGTNQAEWNGRSLGGDYVGNGMYLYKIISGNEVIGSGKLVVFD